MKLPEPGTSVTVRVRNPMYEKRGAYFFDVPEHVTYRGQVYPQQKWQTSEPMLNLTTDVVGFPWRQLPLRQIVDIQVGSETIQVDLPDSQPAKIWTVEGSKGGTYTVTERDGKRTCTCPGFTFRHSCRHTSLEAA